jgi:hypothetical protein
MTSTRIPMPPALTRTFEGPEGRYTADYRPIREWDGVIEVVIRGVAMRWPVDEAYVEDGVTLLCGLTRDSEPLWNDVYWFEIHLDARPPVIRDWGDQVLIREDREV